MLAYELTTPNEVDVTLVFDDLLHAADTQHEVQPDHLVQGQRDSGLDGALES